MRATGRRESASDPAFGGLIADAPKYVQSYDRGPQGEPQVIFDAAAVEQGHRRRSAAASGTRTAPSHWWCSIRRRISADQAADQAGLEQAAAQRGLPISIVPLPVADASGNLLSRQALLEMAHRYGAEQLLVGRPPAASVVRDRQLRATKRQRPAPRQRHPPPRRPAAAAARRDWQWTLYTDFTGQSWSGSLTAGIEDTVDLLAPPAGAVAAQRVRGDGTRDRRSRQPGRLCQHRADARRRTRSQPGQRQAGQRQLRALRPHRARRRRRHRARIVDLAELHSRRVSHAGRRDARGASRLPVPNGLAPSSTRGRRRSPHCASSAQPHLSGAPGADLAGRRRSLRRPLRAGARACSSLAAFSDGLDGYLAKRFNWISDLGKILDPAADKLLLMTVFVESAWLGWSPGG